MSLRDDDPLTALRGIPVPRLSHDFERRLQHRVRAERRRPAPAGRAMLGVWWAATALVTAWIVAGVRPPHLPGHLFATLVLVTLVTVLPLRLLSRPGGVAATRSWGSLPRGSLRPPAV